MNAISACILYVYSMMKSMVTYPSLNSTKSSSSNSKSGLLLGHSCHSISLRNSSVFITYTSCWGHLLHFLLYWKVNKTSNNVFYETCTPFSICYLLKILNCCFVLIKTCDLMHQWILYAAWAASHVNYVFPLGTPFAIAVYVCGQSIVTFRQDLNWLLECVIHLIFGFLYTFWVIQ